MLTIWIVLSIAAVVVDLVTSSFFFAGFAVGGVAAMLAYIQGAGNLTQILLFIILSAAAIAIEFLWFRKKVKKSIPVTPRMEEEYIGRTITLEDNIKIRGRAKIEGIYWTLENTGDEIEKGEQAKIVGIKGNKLLIRKIREEK